MTEKLLPNAELRKNGPCFPKVNPVDILRELLMKSGVKVDEDAFLEARLFLNAPLCDNAAHQRFIEWADKRVDDRIQREVEASRTRGAKPPGGAPRQHREEVNDDGFYGFPDTRDENGRRVWIGLDRRRRKRS